MGDLRKDKTMFTEKAQAVIDLAKDYAYSSGSAELTLFAILAAVGKNSEACVLLTECTSLTAEQVRTIYLELINPVNALASYLWQSLSMQF